MATAYIPVESAPHYPLQLPPRAAIEVAIETLTAVLDAMDGDPDFESDGDLMDGAFSEDEFIDHRLRIHGMGPGCPIADAAEEDDHCGTAIDHGEADEAECGRCLNYGVDQTRPSTVTA